MSKPVLFADQIFIHNITKHKNGKNYSMVFSFKTLSSVLKYPYLWLKLDESVPSCRNLLEQLNCSLDQLKNMKGLINKPVVFSLSLREEGKKWWIKVNFTAHKGPVRFGWSAAQAE